MADADPETVVITTDVAATGAVVHFAYETFDGRKVAELWCEPYTCDIAPYVKPGRDAAIRVDVTSTWYNALVEDAKLPEKDRRTWTKCGPGPDAKYHEAGLVGPATLCVGASLRAAEDCPCG